MSIISLINEKLERQQIQARRADTLVLSEVAYSALRRELLGVETVLKQIEQGELQEIKEYMGMKIVRLDRDDVYVEIG